MPEMGEWFADWTVILVVGITVSTGRDIAQWWRKRVALDRFERTIWEDYL